MASSSNPTWRGRSKRRSRGPTCLPAASSSSAGIGTCIDNFGTEPLPPELLGGWPISTVKIDGSLVRRAGTTEVESALVAELTSQVLSLGRTPVAEGVETQQQLEYVRDCGCRSYQGFLYCAPLPAEDMGRMLADVAGGSSVAGRSPTADRS